MCISLFEMTHTVAFQIEGVVLSTILKGAFINGTLVVKMKSSLGNTSQQILYDTSEN